MTPVELAAVIQGYTYVFSSEVELQDGIEEVLKAAGIAYKREVILSKEDRIDFFVEEGGIGMEVKTKGSISALTRQVHRYVQFESIQGILIVTPLGRLTSLPGAINGKPVIVSHLIESCL